MSEAEQLERALSIINDFIEKVESGRAKSVDTYGRCKALVLAIASEPTVDMDSKEVTE